MTKKIICFFILNFYFLTTLSYAIPSFQTENTFDEKKDTIYRKAILYLKPLKNIYDQFPKVSPKQAIVISMGILTFSAINGVYGDDPEIIYGLCAPSVPSLISLSSGMVVGIFGSDFIKKEKIDLLRTTKQSYVFISYRSGHPEEGQVITEKSRTFERNSTKSFRSDLLENKCRSLIRHNVQSFIHNLNLTFTKGIPIFRGKTTGYNLTPPIDVFSSRSFKNQVEMEKVITQDDLVAVLSRGSVSKEIFKKLKNKSGYYLIEDEKLNRFLCSPEGYIKLRISSSLSTQDFLKDFFFNIHTTQPLSKTFSAFFHERPFIDYGWQKIAKVISITTGALTSVILGAWGTVKIVKKGIFSKKWWYSTTPVSLKNG